MATNVKKDDKKLTLKFKGYSQLINLKDIIYIEYINRRIVINTNKESIKYLSMPLTKFKLDLTDDFIQIHQSIIVNSKYIKTIDRGNKCIKLMNLDHAFAIGRSYQNALGDQKHELS